MLCTAPLTLAPASASLYGLSGPVRGRHGGRVPVHDEPRLRPLSGASRPPCDRRRCGRAAAPRPSEAARAPSPRPRSPAPATAAIATRSTYTGTWPCAVVAASVTRYATERSASRGKATLRSDTRSTPCFANSRRSSLGRTRGSGRADGASPRCGGVGGRLVDLSGRAHEPDSEGELRPFGISGEREVRLADRCRAVGVRVGGARKLRLEPCREVRTSHEHRSRAGVVGFCKPLLRVLMRRQSARGRQRARRARARRRADGATVSC